MAKYWIVVFDEREYYPISGKGWVVKKIKAPTKNKGSKTVWVKHFENEQSARKYASQVKVKSYKRR